MASLDFHPAAAEEALAAEAWYGERNPSAADAFRAELTRAVESVAESPERWPRHVAGTRRRRFHWFPFSPIYRAEDDRMVIIAVAHHQRRPGY